jgi:hypothetical protein
MLRQGRYKDSRQVLTRGRVTLALGKTVRVDIARMLGVSKQRVHQLAAGETFPAPVGTDVRGSRLWDRRAIGAWARAEWDGKRPWRRNDSRAGQRPQIACLSDWQDSPPRRQLGYGTLAR